MVNILRFRRKKEVKEETKAEEKLSVLEKICKDDPLLGEELSWCVYHTHLKTLSIFGTYAESIKRAKKSEEQGDNQNALYAYVNAAGWALYNGNAEQVKEAFIGYAKFSDKNFERILANPKKALERARKYYIKTKVIKTMEIKEEPQIWYRFLVPIPSEPDEPEHVFIHKAKDCLDAFFEEYTKMPKKEWGYKHPFRNSTPDSLKEETLNFRDLELKDIDDCNINFFVKTPQKNNVEGGIEILTDANKETERKPMIDFLKKLWQEFDYKF